MRRCGESGIKCAFIVQGTKAAQSNWPQGSLAVNDVFCPLRRIQEPFFIYRYIDWFVSL